MISTIELNKLGFDYLLIEKSNPKSKTGTLIEEATKFKAHNAIWIEQGTFIFKGERGRGRYRKKYVENPKLLICIYQKGEVVNFGISDDWKNYLKTNGRLHWLLSVNLLSTDDKVVTKLLKLMIEMYGGKPK